MKKICLLVVLAACSKKGTELPASPAVSVVTKTSEKQEGDCSDHAVTPPAVTAAAAATTVTTEARGAKLKGEAKVALADLFTTPEKFDQKTVFTEGMVRQVCQQAGCWMEIANDLEKGPGARITFKDYAFFVPKDARGSKVRIEGSVKLAELSEERAKHYASEGGTIARGHDGKAREVQIIASGVEITRPN